MQVQVSHFMSRSLILLRIYRIRGTGYVAYWRQTSDEYEYYEGGIDTE